MHAHDDLTTLRCPSCGGALTPGYIAGQAMPLRWTEQPNAATVFSGKALHKASGTGSASLPAARCETCRVGVFRYDG